LSWSRRRQTLLALAAAASLAGCGRGEPAAPSVLLVTLDTTRADRLGAYGDGSGATPQLDAFTRRAVVFERAFAVAPMTLPAHATMLTGRLPPRTGLRWNGEQRLDASLPTIAERFREGGYATGAFVSAAVLDAAFGLDRGFEVYDDEVAGEKLEAERKGAETASRALAWLDSQPSGRPLFLWIHLFDPHDPYRPPEPFASRFAADPYGGEIAAADAALAPLLAHARFAAGANAIVAVAGDHGESLGEQGEATHGVLLHEAVLHVPLLLAAPGLPPSRFGGEVGQADLAPTLLALAGLPALQGSDGDALAGDDRPRQISAPRARTLYAESLYGAHVYGWAPLRAARRDGWKLVRGAGERLYDLAADPGEARDLAGSESGRLPTLRRALDELAAAESTAATAPVDEALRARLASLGYLSPAAPVGERAGDVDPYARIAIHERFRELDGALKKGDVEAVELGLREVLAGDPGNRFALAAVETMLREALAKAPDADTRLRLRLPLARLLASAGQRDEAAAELSAIADSPAASAAARSARAWARLERGRRTEARADWEALAAETPADAAPRRSLASLALAERRFADAERWAREAVKLEPASAAARNALAIALEELGRKDEAELEYEAALATDPGYVRAELNLALLRGARGGSADLAAARAGLERVLERAPHEPLALWTLGRLVLAEGDRSRAARLLGEFVAVAPAHPKAAEARALLATLGGA